MISALELLECFNQAQEAVPPSTLHQVLFHHCPSGFLDENTNASQPLPKNEEQDENKQTQSYPMKHQGSLASLPSSSGRQVATSPHPPTLLATSSPPPTLLASSTPPQPGSGGSTPLGPVSPSRFSPPLQPKLTPQGTTSAGSDTQASTSRISPSLQPRPTSAGPNIRGPAIRDPSVRPPRTLEPAPDRPPPTSQATTDPRKKVASLLKTNGIDSIVVASLLKTNGIDSIVLKSFDLMEIHFKLFDLLELNEPLGDEFKSIWKSLTAAHAVTNLVSSRRAYEDAQQHPVAEQLHVLVRLFLHLGLKTEQGVREFERLEPVHSTAGKGKSFTSDEACYTTSCEPAYLLEIKRIDAALEVIRLMATIAAESDTELRPSSDGSLKCTVMNPSLLSDGPDFKKAIQLFSQVYGQLHDNQSQTCAVMCWEAMVVVKLENKTTLAVSRVVYREQGKVNKENSHGKYEKNDVNHTYVWKGKGKQDREPRPTMLSTLVALTMCAPAPAPDDLWITGMSTSTSVPANSNARSLHRVPEEPSEEPSESPQSPEITKEGQNRGTSHDLGRGKAQTRPDILPTGHQSPKSPSDGTAVQQDLLQHCSASTGQPAKTPSCIVELPDFQFSVDLSILSLYRYAAGEFAEPIAMNISPQPPQGKLHVPHLQVNQKGKLGYGRLWVAYEATLWQNVHEPNKSDEHNTASLPGYATSKSGHPGQGAPLEVVVKLTCPNYPMCISDSLSPEPWEYLTVEEAEEAVLREMAMYDGVLKPLQGQVVPNCHAMMRAEVRRDQSDQPVYIYAMVLDRLGREVDPRNTTDLQRIRVQLLYKSLHAVGVRHHDIKPSHILAWQPTPNKNESHYRLIDFEGAETNCSAEQTRAEFKKVEALF